MPEDQKHGLDLHIEAIDSEVAELEKQLADKRKSLEEAKKLDKAAYDLGYAAGFEAGQAAKATAKKNEATDNNGRATALTKEQKEKLQAAFLKTLKEKGDWMKRADVQAAFKEFQITNPQATAALKELVKAGTVLNTGKKSLSAYKAK